MLVMPTNTPVSELTNDCVFKPAFSNASCVSSNKILCCGSKLSVSILVKSKKGASNKSIFFK